MVTGVWTGTKIVSKKWGRIFAVCDNKTSPLFSSLLGFSFLGRSFVLVSLVSLPSTTPYSVRISLKPRIGEKNNYTDIRTYHHHRCANKPEKRKYETY